MTPMRKDIAMLLAARTVGAAQVTSVIGTRLRPDALLENEVLPAGTYSIVNSDPWGHLRGSSGEAQTRVQFTLYALSRETTTKAANAIIDVLDGFTGTLYEDANNPNADSIRVSDCTLDNNYPRWQPDAPGSAKGRYYRVIDFVVSHTTFTPSLVLE